MSLEIISTPPGPDAHIPLAAHQSQTPESFFGAKPVLHYQDGQAKVIISKDHSSEDLPIYRLGGHDAGDPGQIVNGHGDSDQSHLARTEDMVISDIGVWVTSE